jgi:hypothetical protein
LEDELNTFSKKRLAAAVSCFAVSRKSTSARSNPQPGTDTCLDP